MKTFEEVKQIMLDRAKNADACTAGYGMGLRATNKAELLKAVTDNFIWVFKNKVVDADFLNEHFTPEELSQAGIYTAGRAEVNTISFACGSATVEAYGSATVEAYDSATVKAYDSATVKACDSATVKAYGSATVKACGSATVEAYDSATVKACDSATVKAYGSAYLLDYTETHTEPKDDVIIRHRWSGKVFVKKNAFEIVQVE